MVDVAIDHDELLLQNKIASEPICVMRIYFYRGEVVIDGNGRFFRKKKLFKNYVIDCARKTGINSIIYSESISGYQQYQSIQNEFCDSYNSRTISLLDIIDCKSKIDMFCDMNSDILSGHLITYEEKQRLVVSSNIAPDSSGKEALRVFIDGGRLVV